MITLGLYAILLRTTQFKYIFDEFQDTQTEDQVMKDDIRKLEKENTELKTQVIMTVILFM